LGNTAVSSNAVDPSLEGYRLLAISRLKRDSGRTALEFGITYQIACKGVIGKEKVAKKQWQRKSCLKGIKKRLPGKRKRFITQNNHSFSFPIWEAVPFPAMPSILLRKDTDYLPYLPPADSGEIAPENLVFIVTRVIFEVKLDCRIDSNAIAYLKKILYYYNNPFEYS
jgi:hypothetical protein